jgi:hypothetical protein
MRRMHEKPFSPKGPLVALSYRPNYVGLFGFLASGRRHDRHVSEASSFQIGVSRERRIPSNYRSRRSCPPHLCRQVVA